MNNTLLNCVRRVFCATGALVLFGTLHNALAQEQSSEEQAWQQVRRMEAASLANFLVQFSDGKFAPDARLYLSLHKKIEALRAKKEKPAFVIPFTALEPKWSEWKQSRPEKDAVGMYINGSTAGVFRSLGSGGISLDSEGMVAAPTGDGSILAFRTQGLKYEYASAITFQTSGGMEIIYFGVVHGVGLVHLHGAGKVTMPDGKEVVLN